MTSQAAQLAPFAQESAAQASIFNVSWFVMNTLALILGWAVLGFIAFKMTAFALKVIRCTARDVRAIGFERTGTRWDHWCILPMRIVLTAVAIMATHLAAHARGSSVEFFRRQDLEDRS